MPDRLMNLRQTFRRRVRPVFLLSILLALFSAPVISDEDEEAEARLKQLRTKIERLSQQLDLTRKQYDRERDSLRKIELDIGKHAKELKYINYRLKRQDKRLDQLYRDRKRYQNELTVQRELLARQVRTSYVMGQQAYLKILFSTDEPAAIGRTLKYYDYFHRSRGEIIQRAAKALQRFEENRKEIDQETARLKELQEFSRRMKTQLEADSQTRQTVVASLDQELSGKSLSLSRLREDERQLQNLLNEIDKLVPDVASIKKAPQAFAKLKGRLSWPVQGSLQRLFGKRRGNSQVSWNGVIISAREGSDVQAVSHGRVVYADWLRGYGLLLILDHGDGYMSLYGHNQSLFKETGDWVEAGESIATVGNSGGHSRSGLYFEIRKNGKPYNPVSWCRKTRRS